MQQTNILEYLEDTVKRVPDKLAIADEESGITFNELYTKARAVGTYLASKGHEKEPVVVFMEKRPNEVPALFGSVYASNFYVPIDVEMPRARIDLILENLNASAMICDADTVETARDFDFHGEIMLFDEISKTEVDDELLARIRSHQIDTDPIYTVFTSGSTGVPKGVVGCHRAAIDYIENLSEVAGFSQDTVFGNQAPFYMDACMKELYSTIKFGSTTYIIPKQLFMFPLKLVEFLNTYKINTICWVTPALTIISTFKTFDQLKPEYLHTITFTSEVFPIKQLKIWRETLPNATFINLYGPTETTGVCCYYKIDREFEVGDAVPIGRPFKNTDILLLNEKMEEVGPGESGEICVRGTSLTLGYYHNPEKTAEVFVQNPLNDRYPELIYRTGDMGKYNERGELMFGSRKDFQIKHMGHRIELGEIEANVNTVEGVRLCCCVYKKEKGKIVLYYSGEIERKDLIATLRDKVPRYMIPNKTVKLDEIPLLPNGKIDRNQLKNL